MERVQQSTPLFGNDRVRAQASAQRRRISEPSRVLVREEATVDQDEDDPEETGTTDIDSSEDVVSKDPDIDIDLKEMAKRHEKLMRDIAAIQRRIRSLTNFQLVE